MSTEFKQNETSIKQNDIFSTVKNTGIDTTTGKEFQEAEKGAKKVVSEYCKKKGNEIAPRPMEEIFTQNWKRIQFKKDINTTLKECNPLYSMGKEWRINCQRCVPTYEMRCRGYDVTAAPKPSNPERTDLSYSPYKVWQNPEVFQCSGNGINDIEKKMQDWGDGARAQVVVVWKNTNAGHTFVAERVNGKTVFIDPQNGKNDVKSYFSHVENGSVRIARIDNQDVTSKILDCCRKV